jgi:hypothetical protein
MEAEADRCRDAGKLGAAVPAVRRALRTGRRAPADPDSLALSGFQVPVEMEVPTRTATDSSGAEAAHPADGAGESTVGSGTDRQRAVGEARTACLAAHRAEVSTVATGGASAWGSALGDVPEEPCAGDRGVRLLRHRDECCPKANAICERVIGTIRRECLDWLIPLSAHLRRALRLWVEHYNRGRPHMMLGPACPTLRRPDQPRRRSLATASRTSTQCVAKRCPVGCITSTRCALPERNAVFAEYRGISPRGSRVVRDSDAPARLRSGDALKADPLLDPSRSEPRLQAIERAQVSVLTRSRPACRTPRPTRWPR